MSESAYVGIDVAIAKKKRLPLCASIVRNGRLSPLKLRSNRLPKPPMGMGNKFAIDPETVKFFVYDVRNYIREIEEAFNIRVIRIAIDAPSSYKRDGSSRRAAEQEMDRRKISCFATPSQSEFKLIIEKVNRHINEGGSESKMPHANQLWMLVGFALFEELGKHYECLEVFPQATAVALNCASGHKSKPDGFATQLYAVSQVTGWKDAKVLESELKAAAYGLAHDRLDAYLSAWVGSLPEDRRFACGAPPDDVIWIPIVEP